MQNILSKSDYADGLHPNANGYDKMARTWEPAIRTVLSVHSQQSRSQAASRPFAGEDAKRAVSAASERPAIVPVIRYIPGSTTKLEQLIGDEDKERHQPTLSRTVTRYGVQGTDLGYSFEHSGRAYFLFGDTVGRLNRALDTIATTDALDPERGVRLDFLTIGGDYLTIRPPGISMGAFEVPVSGISLGNQIYVIVSTNHSVDRTTDRSVLTKFVLLRPLSRFARFLSFPGPIYQDVDARRAGVDSRTTAGWTFRPHLGNGCVPRERRVSLDRPRGKL